LEGDKLKYKRVLLKLSGEVLAGTRSFGIDFDAVSKICREILEVARHGIQIAMVVGGGNIFRGAQAVSMGMDRPQADYMGMLATVINALALQDNRASRVAYSCSNGRRDAGNCRTLYKKTSLKTLGKGARGDICCRDRFSLFFYGYRRIASCRRDRGRLFA